SGNWFRFGQGTGAVATATAARNDQRERGKGGEQRDESLAQLHLLCLWGCRIRSGNLSGLAATYRGRRVTKPAGSASRGRGRRSSTSSPGPSPCRSAPSHAAGW